MLQKFKVLLPARFRKDAPVIPMIRLHGAIGIGSPLRPALTMKGVEPLLARAFKKGVPAVALAINSPGGSAVQSALIARRIRALAAEHGIRVFAFCEDVAASGGYWLASAADEIYADPMSIVGSIGVISASFGFQDAIAKLGIERRIHTAGESKSILDPFEPEKPEDVARLKALQEDAHAVFKDHVRERRAGKLQGDEAELFSGAFWSGRRALELGLIDGLGHMDEVLRHRFGKDMKLKAIEPAQGFSLRRLGIGASGELADAALQALEVRSLWSRFGL